jgi:hypothetical protein
MRERRHRSETGNFAHIMSRISVASKASLSSRQKPSITIECGCTDGTGTFAIEDKAIISLTVTRLPGF